MPYPLETPRQVAQRSGGMVDVMSHTWLWLLFVHMMGRRDPKQRR